MKQSFLFANLIFILYLFTSCGSSKTIAGAVSYTHLDVYKRQVLYRATDNNIVATGSTTQVFLNTNRELELATPAFYQEWKKKWNIL